jgi:hypothetical protein
MVFLAPPATLEAKKAGIRSEDSLSVLEPESINDFFSTDQRTLLENNRFFPLFGRKLGIVEEIEFLIRFYVLVLFSNEIQSCHVQLAIKLQCTVVIKLLQTVGVERENLFLSHTVKDVDAVAPSPKCKNSMALRNPIPPPLWHIQNTLLRQVVMAFAGTLVLEVVQA